MAFHIYQRKKHQNLYFPSFYFFIVSVFFYFFLSFFKYFLHSLHFIYSFIYLVLYVSSFLSSSLPVFPSFFFFRYSSPSSHDLFDFFNESFSTFPIPLLTIYLVFFKNHAFRRSSVLVFFSHLPEIQTARWNFNQMKNARQLPSC